MFPILPANSATTSFPENDEGIFGFGSTAGGRVAITNLVSNTGVASSDVAGAAGVTVRSLPGACEYGGDKGIYGYGYMSGSQSISNLVSNTGVVASDTTGVGTARYYVTACSYGEDKGIFGFGWDNAGGDNVVSTSNLVSNAGVVSSDVTGVGTARYAMKACEYGGDKGIFGFGSTGTPSYTQVSITNLVSNTGVVASDQAATTGTARYGLAACTYGGDKGIFGYGREGGTNVSMTNLVSNAGVVSSDVTGVGQTRLFPAATQYGQDKGIFGYGEMVGSKVSMTNLVSNTGVVSSDVTGVGSGREALAACSFN